MKSYDLKRRQFLHTLLAAGSVAVLPVLTIGCDRKRNFPDPKVEDESDAATPETQGANKAESSNTGSNPSTKMSKEQAGYQEKQNGDQRCADCRYFNAGDNSCQLVEGSISPDAWCMLYVKTA